MYSWIRKINTISKVSKHSTWQPRILKNAWYLLSGKCKICKYVRNSWCSITTNCKIFLSFMIWCFDICNSALIRIRLHPDPDPVKIWPDPTVMDLVGSGSGRILKCGIRCTPNCGGRAVDVCEPTQFSVGVMCQFPRCNTSAKMLARVLAANLQRLDPGTL